ncbi:MAG: hypothetical protein JST54_02370 [Deltaproteobacteria bacterium]|nr:hypothetical protein [Deltaproteobacteria bacterium]
MKRLLVLALLVVGACGPPPHEIETSTGSGSTTGTSGTTGSTCNSTDTWSGFAEGFFSDHCASCHSAFTDYATVKGDESSIRGAIAAGFMPQGQPLDPNTQTRIVAWLDCGAPR